jgi:hypothetical protein
VIDFTGKNFATTQPADPISESADESRKQIAYGPSDIKPTDIPANEDFRSVTRVHRQRRLPVNPMDTPTLPPSSGFRAVKGGSFASDKDPRALKFTDECPDASTNESTD